MGKQKRQEKEQGIETYLKKQQQKTSLPGEGKRHTSPASSDSPKQVGPKEAYTKAHHNHNDKA